MLVPEHIKACKPIGGKSKHPDRNFEKRLNEEHYRIHSDGQQPYSKMSVPLIQGKCWLKSPGETSIFFPQRRMECWKDGSEVERVQETQMWLYKRIHRQTYINIISKNTNKILKIKRNGKSTLLDVGYGLIGSITHCGRDLNGIIALKMVYYIS